MSVQTQIDRINQNVANTYAVLSALGADMPNEQSSDNLATTAGTAKAVLHSKQTLTATQQAQARTNIGAASQEEVRQLSENKANKQGLSLGVGSDGLVYLFVDGVAQGNGLDINADAVAGDVVGYVDENNTIILTGALADGTYTFKYEDDEGNTTDIGSIKLGGPSYTNLADPTSEDWATDKRLNSSAELVDATGCHTTNFFPCVKGNVIRVKGLDIRYTNSEHTQNARAWFYNSVNYAIVATYPVSEPKIAFDGVDTFTITLDGLTNISGGSEEDVVKGRLSGMLFDGYTKEDIVITKNQEIAD